MDRSSFGRLVASLRREQQDEERHSWTQRRLAEEANGCVNLPVFSERIIGGIERGERMPDKDSLVALAKALGLTAGEQHELALAASGMDDKSITGISMAPKQILTVLLQRLGMIGLPACIADPYGDMLAVNGMAAAIFCVHQLSAMAEATSPSPFRNNLVRAAVCDEAVDDLKCVSGMDLSVYAPAIIVDFRVSSLRYRGTMYFEALVKELQRHRAFCQNWPRICLPEADAATTGGVVLEWPSPARGHMTWLATGSVAMTSAGQLRLMMLVPAARRAAQFLHDFTRWPQGADVIRLDTSWPEKAVPAAEVAP